MAKQPNDNLERFFLKRVKDYKIDYREEDWARLDEVLDASKAMKVAALKQKIVWVGSGALFVISIVLLLWMSQNLTSQRTDDTKASIGSEIVESRGQENNSNQASIQPLTYQENRSISERETVENKTSDLVKEDPGIKDTKDSKNLAESENRASNDIKPIINQEEPNESERNVGQIRQEESVTLIEDVSMTNKIAEPVMIFKESNDTKEPATINLKSSGWYFDSIEGNGIAISTNLMKASEPIQLRKNYAWNLSIAADNSAVGVTDFDGPSIRAGVSFEYYISSQFSVLAGDNYSVKTYSAFGREYTPPYGFWTWGVVPDETRGECRVLDIPINFSYYIPNMKGQAIFVRAGLSSWLMLEEHYFYSYESNDPSLVNYWGGENENYHYFSILNLSAGFEHPLNNKFSILAEPYFNIPLSGVGYGQVDLYSAGLKFTIKINHYKLTSK